MSIATVLINRAERNLIRVHSKILEILNIQSDLNSYYFAYAGNLNLKSLSKYGIPFKKIGNASLSNYKLQFDMPCEYTGIGFASIRNEKDSCVYGTLYQCSDLLIRYLDNTEWTRWGYYKRILVTVDSGDKKLNAWAYIALNKKENLAAPSWYLNSIINSATENLFPESYISSLKKTPHALPKEIDIQFNMSSPASPRPRFFAGESWLRKHDQLREFICKKLK